MKKLNHPKVIKVIIALIFLSLGWFFYIKFTSHNNEIFEVVNSDAEISVFSKFPENIEKLVSIDTSAEKINKIESNRLKYSERVNDLLSKAEKLKPSNWSNKIPSGNERAPALLKFTAKGELIANEGLQVYFAYYLDLLGSTVGLEEGASRLLESLKVLPPAAQTKARKLLESYLNVEFALVDMAIQGSQNKEKNGDEILRRYNENAKTTDPAVESNEIRSMTLTALSNQKERELLISLHGQNGASELYKETTDRAHEELQASLIASDPNYDERTKVAQLLNFYKAPIGGLADQEDPSGRIKLLYETIDAAVISHSKRLSETEKSQLRTYFFSAKYKQN